MDGRHCDVTHWLVGGYFKASGLALFFFTRLDMLGEGWT